MSDAICKTCRFLHQDQRGFACRRMPPTTQTVFVPKTDLARGGVVPEEQTRSMYPRVNPDWWCGEWQLKPGLAQ